MHHRRHRAIGTLLKQLEAYDVQISALQTRAKPKKLKGPTGDFGQLETPLDEIQPPPKAKLPWCEKLSGINKGEFMSIQQHHEKAGRDISIADKSEVTHLSVIDGPSTPDWSSSISSNGQDGTPALSMKKKALKKARRAAQYASENEHAVVNNEFLDFIGEALHDCKIMDKGCAVLEEGEANFTGQFKNEKLVNENLGFQQFKRNEQYGRQTACEKKTAERLGKEEKAAIYCPIALGFAKPNFVDIDQHTRIDANFFVRLGIKLGNPHNNSKRRRKIVVKLVKAITADMGIVEREEQDMVMREAGFWRYINRTAAFNLQEGHQGFSWATGELTKGKRASTFAEESDLHLLGDISECEQKEESELTGNDSDGDGIIWTHSTARPAFRSIRAEIEVFLENYNVCLDGWSSLEHLCKFTKDAGIFTEFRTSFDKMCTEIEEKSECKLTTKERLVVNVGTRTNPTTLRYQTLDVPVICLLDEEDELTAAIKADKDRLAEEAKSKRIVLKFTNYAATKNRGLAPSTPVKTPTPVTTPSFCSSNKDTFLSATLATTEATATAAVPSDMISAEPPCSPRSSPMTDIPSTASKPKKKKREEDDWEAVLPSLPPIKTKNSFDLLNTIKEPEVVEVIEYKDSNCIENGRVIVTGWWW